MVVENEELQRLFKLGKDTGNWDPFFLRAQDVVDYTISTKFSNIKFYHYDPESLIQECLMQVWNLILRKQIEENNNIFSYIIGAVSYLLRDCIRKENRRKERS